MTMIGRLAALWATALAALMLIGSTPARADVISDYRAELDAMALEMRALWGEIERFKIQQRYCLPPYAPQKQPDTMQMQVLSARADALNDKYNALKMSLQDFLKRNTWAHGRLQVAGKDPSNAGWWARWDTSRDKMIAERNAKRDALARAPERNCAPTSRPAIAVQPPPPLVLPQRPQIPPFNWPALPPHFCSEHEKLNWRIANINPGWQREAEVAHAVARYRSQVEGLVNDHVQADKPIPPALAEARRQAIADVREMDRLEKENAAFYRRFAAVPVIDCPPPTPQTEPPRVDVRPPVTPPADPPQADMRTGQVPPQEGLQPLDEQAIARQQGLIEAVEATFNELREAKAKGDCRQLWFLGEEIDEWLWELSPSTPAILIGVTVPRPVLPPGQVEKWEAELEAIMKDCPPPGPKLHFIYIPPKGTVEFRFLDEHNKARIEFGSVPLRWDPALAASAAAAARQMTETGRTHSSREGREQVRENLLQSLRGGRTIEQMVRVWLDEQRNFVPGTFPNVSRTGDWTDIGHYTQIIWPTTTHVGCAVHRDARFDWTVCHYSPPGNRDGTPILAGNNTPMPQLRGEVAGEAGIAPAGSTSTTGPPPPPPPPTARDDAPEGNEALHPLIGYGVTAYLRFDAARDCGDKATADAELAKLRYAIDELKKRLKAAKKAGPFSAIKPEDVQRQLDNLERFLKLTETPKPPGPCPPPPPPPPPM